MHLDRRHLEDVRTILAEHLPPDIAVLAFGSRVHGRNLKRFSDLDLCLKGAGPVPDTTLQALRDAFEESALPIKVDIVDWRGLTPEFQAAIAGDLTLLWNRGPDCERSTPGACV